MVRLIFELRLTGRRWRGHSRQWRQHKQGGQGAGLSVWQNTGQSVLGRSWQGWKAIQQAGPGGVGLLLQAVRNHCGTNQACPSESSLMQAEDS